MHSGDAISPSLLSGIDKGAHQIDILNQMGVDIMVPGNHEFDFGPDIFRARIGEAKFPIVNSNIREPDGSQPANTVDEKIVEIEGIKIGFYGLTTEDTTDPRHHRRHDLRRRRSRPGEAKAAALARGRRGFRRRGGAHAARTST